MSLPQAAFSIFWDIISYPVCAIFLFVLFLEWCDRTAPKVCVWQKYVDDLEKEGGE